MKTLKIINFMLLSSTCLIGLSLTASPVSPSAKKDTKTMTKKAMSAKIAVVDVRQIFTQELQALKDPATVSHEWRDLYTKLQETLRPANQEISELQAQFETKRKELEALQKSGVSSQESLREKYDRELAPLIERLQVQSQQLQRFSYEELNKIQGIVGPKVQKAVDEVLQKQGWDFAVSREVITSSFASGSPFNITADVLLILNAQYAQSKPKQPQPQKVQS